MQTRRSVPRLQRSGKNFCLVLSSEYHKMRSSIPHLKRIGGAKDENVHVRIASEGSEPSGRARLLFLPISSEFRVSNHVSSVQSRVEVQRDVSRRFA